MDNLNRIVSFILGLVVVLVFFAFVTGRLNLGKRLTFSTSNIFGRRTTVTPTPKTSPTPTSTTASGTTTNNDYQPYNVAQKTPSTSQTIPATGLPTIFIPSLIAGALGGVYLRRIGRK